MLTRDTEVSLLPVTVPRTRRPSDDVSMRADYAQHQYVRELPGGGYVAVVVDERPVAADVVAPVRGRVVIERRAAGAGRRTNTRPVLARVGGETVSEVVDLLLPIAVSNEEIARALLALRRR